MVINANANVVDLVQREPIGQTSLSTRFGFENTCNIDKKVKQFSPIFDISEISVRIFKKMDRDICISIIYLGSRQIGRNFVGDIWKYIPLN